MTSGPVDAALPSSSGRGAGSGPRIRRCSGPAAAVAAAAATLVVVVVVDPGEAGHYPTCPLLYTTGLFCPGCGTLRALHALAHLDIADAVGLNVLTVAAVPLLAWSWWTWLRRRWSDLPRRSLASPWRLWSLVVVVLAFSVLRNLPGTSFLAP